MSGSLTSGGEMSNTELLQQMALWQWLTSQSEDDRGVLASVTGVRLASELFNRITGQDQINAFKRECIVGIADFLKQNPGATEAQINSEVEKRVVLFAARVQALNQQPLL
ncbi:hypothetical protein NQD34_006694 [Periophthalmus magnuspinnatus]|uniref:Uncharacterized protein n=1 Tax=Periophthalmus magnuspinnatus TaxID=409849 RepID=A0A3B3ZK53_9GOBI|nr:hypothetical protein NQD34_006694 [Periophthalmus magnuspinnatus]